MHTPANAITFVACTPNMPSIKAASFKSMMGPRTKKISSDVQGNALNEAATKASPNEHKDNIIAKPIMAKIDITMLF